MKKKINIKKIFVISIVLIIIILTIIFLVVKYTRNNDEFVVPSIENEQKQDDGMIKYENHIKNIEIKDRKIMEFDNNQYIIIEIENSFEEDKFDLPIGIEFANLDGDVIYNTGYVVDVLLKGMTSQIYAVITPQIAELIEKDKIDHIIIKELQ